jgi:hypothetical protein
LSLEVDDHPELIDTLLAYLGEAGNPPGRRLAVLNLLQEISFRMVGFPAKRPEYLAMLRSIIEDPDSKLRRVAIGILAREKDDYVQRRLVDGLEDASKALVPAAKAIQFLAYDVHSEYFPIAKRIVENPPSRMRGYLLAAFENAGLPEEALPYVFEELESGRDAYLVAAAAKALRGRDSRRADAVPFLLKAIENIKYADDAVSFDSYRPSWPPLGHTTALQEIAATITWLGSEAHRPCRHCGACCQNTGCCRRRPATSWNR